MQSRSNRPNQIFKTSSVFHDRMKYNGIAILLEIRRNGIIDRLDIGILFIFIDLFQHCWLMKPTRPTRRAIHLGPSAAIVSDFTTLLCISLAARSAQRLQHIGSTSKYSNYLATNWLAVIITTMLSIGAFLLLLSVFFFNFFRKCE